MPLIHKKRLHSHCGMMYGNIFPKKTTPALLIFFFYNIAILAQLKDHDISSTLFCKVQTTFCPLGTFSHNQSSPEPKQTCSSSVSPDILAGNGHG